MPAVTMPRLSDSMESGVILHWLVDDGEPVSTGAPLVEIETDKATVVYDAPAEGILSIEVQAGETVAVGARLGTLGGGEEPAVAPVSAGNGAAAGDRSTAAGPVAGGGSAVADQAGGDSGPVAAGGGSAVADQRAGGRIIASPLARRLAAGAGIDLSAVSGTGPRGRIIKRDVEAATPGGAAPTAPTPAAGATAPAADGRGDDETEVHRLSRVQEVIARRMAESHAAVPNFSLTVEADMQAVSELRERMKAEADGEPVPSVNDFVVKAAALALGQVPRANGAYHDGTWRLHPRVNIGVAVAADDSLLVPVVADADRRGLGEIATVNRRLAARARAGELTPTELSGATFTVSNLGMFEIARFTAIVDAPQAAILAVGAVIDRVVAHEGRPAIRPRLELTLCCDHRILYGADAARFLVAIRDGLQRPTRLLL